MAPPIFCVTSSSVASTSASKLDDQIQSEHAHRRFFIGPMPQKVLSTPEELKRQNKRKHIFTRTGSSDTTDEELTQIIKIHARSFFLRQGGREEDWGENEEQTTREEMYRRWKESEWGVALRRLRGQEAKPNKQPNNWIGGSFEIGNIVGINIMDEADSLSRVSTRNSQLSAPIIPLESALEPLGPSSHGSLATEQQTFVTAPSMSTEHPQVQTQASSASPISQNSLSPINCEHRNSRAPSPSSSTALLRPATSRKHDSDPSHNPLESTRRPIMKLPSFSRTNESTHKIKKTVHYNLSPVESNSSLPPTSPTTVLERTGTDVSGTSAGAMSISAMDVQQINWGDTVMRDRMLVRIYSTETVNMFSSFDESVHRVTHDLKYEDWGEFLVVWRMDRIEIYENYTIPGKEWVTGHKHLSYIIPLKSTRTRLFLYCFVDLTFCITCSPTTRRFNPVKAKWTIHSAKEGSNIFIFKPKCRSRASDWIWRLWKHRGGTLPPTVEIRNPRLDSKLKIDMPTVESIHIYKIFSKDNLIALSVQSLRAVPDWKYAIERQLAEGDVLQLCWRQGSYLDWIWLDDDVDGRPRDWAVLCGLALKQTTTPVHLELRVAQHHSEFVHRKDGARLGEPPSIEGYVDHVKPNTHVKQALYLATHDGNLFVLNPSRAHPPTPLGATLQPIETDVGYAYTLRKSEVKRGIQQLLDANGVVDLRSILVVRRAVHPTMQPTHNLREHDDASYLNVGETLAVSQSDQEDIGGEEGLNRSENQRELRMKRSFELLLENGHILRFETFSCMFTNEWVEKLQALVNYWRVKHRIDAKEEMKLAQGYRPPVTPHIYAETDRTMYAEPPVDPSSTLPALGSLFNWCVLDGCKPIAKSGKVFMRQGLHGQYRLVDLVLASERLIHFRISPKSVIHRSMRKKIDLVDAYVCSGYLGAQVLPVGQFNPTENNVPRRYQDGLETDDAEEDRLFVIWYRKTSAEEGSGDSSTRSGADLDIPPLSAKRKFVIFRTRSRLERDAWCWALSSTIEKAVRARKEREHRLRERGRLMDL
ncbi:Pleckstrin homology domain-containing protein [Lentinula aciculospora]|uniref:Pleckstrin homology domain-containing protein n=1 Tax=Lentinula aciculospora TaxID=153920 RepID=A0A9W9DR25_9AGAR|nr:Pleckstrin homology domain-containing protein [Lentinula aciculospora]